MTPCTSNDARRATQHLRQMQLRQATGSAAPSCSRMTLCSLSTIAAHTLHANAARRTRHGRKRRIAPRARATPCPRHAVADTNTANMPSCSPKVVAMRVRANHATRGAAPPVAAATCLERPAHAARNGELDDALAPVELPHSARDRTTFCHEKKKQGPSRGVVSL